MYNIKLIIAYFGSAYAGWQKTKMGGSCKTPVPRKIDDFGANSQSQLVGMCRADESIPERVGEESRRELAPKGRFCEGREFCNCLIYLFIFSESAFGCSDPPFH